MRGWLFCVLFICLFLINPCFALYDYLGVWGTESQVYIVGVKGSGFEGIIRCWDGVEWKTMAEGDNYLLRAIWGTSANNVFTVGINHVSGYDIGSVFHFNGSRWRRMRSITSNQLVDVWGVLGKDVYAAGYYGMILKMSPCEGDVDGDNDVDWLDSIAFMESYGNVACIDDCPTDFDVDKDTDGKDLAIFISDISRTDCPQYFDD